MNIETILMTIDYLEKLKEPEKDETLNKLILFWRLKANQLKGQRQNTTDNIFCRFEPLVGFPPITLLELFAGHKSISKVADKLGWQTFTSDINPGFKTDYTIDILNFDIKKVPFIPDVIWASPICTTYSLAAINTHRIGKRPKTDLAFLSDKMVLKTQEIIKHFLTLKPHLVFYIENPRATLRKMPFMRVGEMFSKNIIDIPFRTTVTYCQYGDRAMKPTDIWHNNPNWIAKPMCKNGDSCHEPAPRGSKTGTQGKLNAAERSLVPAQLAFEILEAIKPTVWHFTRL